MKMTDLSILCKWESLKNCQCIKYLFAPLYVVINSTFLRVCTYIFTSLYFVTKGSLIVLDLLYTLISFVSLKITHGFKKILPTLKETPHSLCRMTGGSIFHFKNKPPALIT